jgi:hypothetical protein
MNGSDHLGMRYLAAAVGFLGTLILVLPVH